MLECDPKKPTHVLNLPQMQSEANVRIKFMQTKPPPSITPKITRFKLMYLNIDSVLGHIDQLRNLLDQEKPHIMCLNETKLDLSISDSLVNVDNYQIIRNDRDRHGGEVAVYVHESIFYKIRSDLMPNNLEVVTLKIANSTFKPFIVTSIYRPSGKPSLISNIWKLYWLLLIQTIRRLSSWGIQTVIFWINKTTTPKI